MGKVTVKPFEASDSIFSEGPTRYSPISIRQRLQMMEADAAVEGHANSVDQNEGSEIERLSIGKTSKR